MTYSSDCVSLVKESEGLVLHSYRDAVGILTAGWGHTGDDVHWNQTWTEAQAEAALAEDLTRAAGCVSRNVTHSITQGQFDALTDFVFNLGCGRLKESTLLRKLNAGDIQGAATELNEWVYGGGRILPGLVTRRAAEKALFLRGVA